MAVEQQQQLWCCLEGSEEEGLEQRRRRYLLAHCSCASSCAISIRLFGCFYQGMWAERFVLLLLVDDDVMFAPPLITGVV